MKTPPHYEPNQNERFMTIVTGMLVAVAAAALGGFLANAASGKFNRSNQAAERIAAALERAFPPSGIMTVDDACRTINKMGDGFSCRLFDAKKLPRPSLLNTITPPPTPRPNPEPEPCEQISTDKKYLKWNCGNRVSSFSMLPTLGGTAHE